MHRNQFLSKIKHQIILLVSEICLEICDSMGRRHVEICERYVIWIWWWTIQVSSLFSHDFYRRTWTYWWEATTSRDENFEFYFKVNKYNNCISLKVKWQTAKLSLKRKSLGKTWSQPRSCVPKMRLVLLLFAAAASKWVLPSNRLMSQFISHHPHLLMMGMFPPCLKVVIMTIQLSTERAVLHPRGLMLRPKGQCLVVQVAIVAGLMARVYTIPKRIHTESRLLKGSLGQNQRTMMSLG